jgi:hypothetical protein
MSPSRRRPLRPQPQSPPRAPPVFHLGLDKLTEGCCLVSQTQVRVAHVTAIFVLSNENILSIFSQLLKEQHVEYQLSQAYQHHVGSQGGNDVIGWIFSPETMTQVVSWSKPKPSAGSCIDTAPAELGLGQPS